MAMNRSERHRKFFVFIFKGFYYTFVKFCISFLGLDEFLSFVWLMLMFLPMIFVCVSKDNCEKFFAFCFLF